MKRRSTNQRGTPVRAAFQWVMLEEARLAIEARMNDDNLSTARPFREIVNQFTGEFLADDFVTLKNKYCSDNHEVLDSTFNSHNVEPLMPVNTLWQNALSGSYNQTGYHQITEVGFLIETQTIACPDEMLALGKCWWPLTSAIMSRNLNVSYNKN